MRTLAVEAVFEDGSTPSDGSEPLLAFAQDVIWPQWTDGVIDISCVASSGLPYDITGGALIFSVRTRNQAAPPVISRESVITDASGGLAYVIIGSLDVGINVQTLAYSMAFVDVLGKVWPVIAQGSFAVVASEYVPGQDVTVPESQQPLAQGPNLGHVDDYTALLLVDPATKAWLFYETDDDGAVYYSNGVSWVVVGSATYDRLVSDGALVANTYVTPSGTTTGRVVAFDVLTMDPALADGVTLDAAAGAGVIVRVVRIRGTGVQILLDSAGNATRAEVLYHSELTPGTVSTDGGQGLVTATISRGAAVAGALVDARF